MAIDKQQLLREHPDIKDFLDLKSTLWLNPGALANDQIWQHEQFTIEDIEAADADLHRYAPLLEKVFPETVKTHGIIESPLVRADKMGQILAEKENFSGHLLVKLDSELSVAGSIKARGGMYEVLKFAEKLALKNGIIADKDDDYTKLASPAARQLFSQYKVQVGSTGNLGLSIGITAAGLGFKAIVHMSADATQWKKDLLREKGAKVIEYTGDYNTAVAQGRKESDADPHSYFVDDEKSATLFLGYAVAALRMRKQLKDLGIKVDRDHPMFIYSPCGVGGSPAGVCYGMKILFGDAAHTFFVESTHCPSVGLGMATGLNEQISVKDVGIDGKTAADGLACGRPSGIAGRIMKPILAGDVTVDDAKLFDYMRLLHDTEDRIIEPSSCAAFAGPVMLYNTATGKKYMADHGLTPEIMKNSIHVAWATGGSKLPEATVKEYLNTHLD